eukprot:2388558-Prymnesium_polylepis.1
MQLLIAPRESVDTHTALSVRCPVGSGWMILEWIGNCCHATPTCRCAVMCGALCAVRSDQCPGAGELRLF